MRGVTRTIVRTGSLLTNGRAGEFDFIERIRRQELARCATSTLTLITHHSSLITPQRHRRRRRGLRRQRAGFDTVITADLLVEGVDFRLDTGWTTPRDLGHKALAVSLSDVAAMGARPRFCLLSVGVPRALWRGAFLEEFYEASARWPRRTASRIIGGDTSRTPERVVIDSVVLGEVRRGRASCARRRAGGRPDFRHRLARRGGRRAEDS